MEGRSQPCWSDLGCFVTCILAEDRPAPVCTQHWHPGANTLAIEVANTLAWQLHDGQSTHMLWKPTGLPGEPKLLLDAK
jgi:hypothetical protein